MKINRRLVPLKIHYFFFLGCMAPILPFIIVVAAQLGIPVSIQGTLSAIILLMTVLGKPFIAALADTFPKYRKGIFLVTLTLMVCCYTSVWFIPPMRETPVLSGQLVRASVKSKVPSKVSFPGNGRAALADFTSQPLLLSYDTGSCYIAVAWDCVTLCSEPWMCISGNSSQGNIKARKVDGDQEFQIATDPSDVLPTDEDLVIQDNVTMLNWTVPTEIPYDVAKGHLYHLEGIDLSWDHMSENVSLICSRANMSGQKCEAAWNYWEFWVYIFLLLFGQISFATGVSITDAIAVDSTSDNQGSYGSQRAWGTVGWGLMGPISGLLVDLWSGSSITKNYTPAFLLVFILGSFDIITCASSLKVPQIGSEKSVMKDVGPLLRQPRFFIFCCFVIMNGLFDGVVANFIFILQEEMAQGTSAMRYMKFLQGFTLFVQCSIEAPFMFVYGWFMQKLGAQRVTSLVFFLYIFRLLGLSMVGFYGPVWATLLTELLNGPCYGLGYTAIVVFSAKISPPGTSTTIQSIVNICYESFGYALAAFLGGLLFEALGGAKMYLVMGFASIVTFFLHYLSLKFLPPPEEFANGVAASPKREEPGRDPEEEMALNEADDPDRSHRGSIESAQTVEETVSLELK
ncbi:uncharacterized protein LOC135198669 [Macrobrachium nipponense]|uniref:uncharacterized protein LOC135198669 n=1 Tax=Macrobrachium nipponense TaxID=159736 RepID=UPI0030C83E4C